MRIGVTGHRWIPSTDRPALVEKLRSALVQHDAVTACSGMAIGADQMFAEVCVAAGVPFIAFVPCQGQEKVWPIPAQRVYKSLLTRAMRVVRVHDGSYFNGCMQRRNQAMIDWLAEVPGSVLLAVWDGRTTGGTYDTVCRAYEVGLAVEVI